VVKKYFPYIALLAAALLLFWVKKNQRGETDHNKVNIEQPVTGKIPFERNIELLAYSKHAKCRMDCRHIDESEVKEILLNGEINYNRIEESPKGKTYPIEGITHDKQKVRLVVAPHEDEIVVVTVIDLEKEWNCDCN